MRRSVGRRACPHVASLMAVQHSSVVATLISSCNSMIWCSHVRALEGQHFDIVSVRVRVCACTYASASGHILVHQYTYLCMMCVCVYDMCLNDAHSAHHATLQTRARREGNDTMAAADFGIHNARQEQPHKPRSPHNKHQHDHSCKCILPHIIALERMD